ncbi:histone acetylation protein-domain-containing protein [Acrodontium crateriforme]|uniref:histone acetyltransferase n=1 Tax=Acrodontium crateriforme TaxID=150365 RepID=A0AAQ3RA61_9PEZI|nr:histone acetylation protein-domain-containing protein [Acrodontium crateriforme]
MEPTTLKDELKAALPEGLECKFRYIQTSPKPCDALFSPPPGQKPEDTKLASHLITASVTPEQGATSQDVLVLAVEVLVFTTRRLTTIFVSKADSTGYLPQHKPSAVKSICSAYLKWLSNRLRHKNPSRKLVISLFARSQSQYLFPGSAENSSKHVLDDRQLIKWWARVLHPILANQSNQTSPNNKPEYQGYMTVPDYDKSELRSFFPRESLASGRQHWIAGHPLEELAEARKVSPAAPPRCLLPRFPDDPKSRFMEDLDEEVGISDESKIHASPSKRKDGKWSSIHDLARFWEAMEFRQECSSGRSVGFLWLVMSPQGHPSASQAQEPNPESNKLHPPSPPLKSSQPTAKPPKTKTRRSKKSKKLTGPIVPRKPRLKGSASPTDTSAQTNAHAETNDALLLTKDGYDQAMQTLLHLDFATREVAAHSTAKWVAEVFSLRALRKDWAWAVVGTAKPEQATAENGVAIVNNIGGMLIKKKSKVEVDGTVSGSAETKTELETPAVNVLGAGMIRKKPKTS